MGVVIVSASVPHVLIRCFRRSGGNNPVRGMKATSKGIPGNGDTQGKRLVNGALPVNGESLGNACGMVKPQGEFPLRYPWGA
jgi:hypothetical protein